MLNYDVAVKAENLVVAYGSVVAVNGLTFQVRRGEVMAYLDLMELVKQVLLR